MWSQDSNEKSFCRLANLCDEVCFCKFSFEDFDILFSACSLCVQMQADKFSFTEILACSCFCTDVIKETELQERNKDGIFSFRPIRVSGLPTYNSFITVSQHRSLCSTRSAMKDGLRPCRLSANQQNKHTNMSDVIETFLEKTKKCF